MKCAVDKVADDATMATVPGIPRRVTYRDLQSWPDDGRRYELHDGEVVVVPAPFPRHQIVMLELTDRLHAFVREHGGIVLVSAVAGKLGGCYLGARLTGVPGPEAASIAALMNTRALMGLVAITISLELGLLTRELFTMFVIMALLTTVMTGPLLRLWLPPDLRVR